MFHEQNLIWNRNFEKISTYILNPSSPSLHTIIELSRTHMNRYKDNMIILSGIQIRDIKTNNNNCMENRDVQYSNIEIGKHVQVSNCYCNGVKMTTIQLEQMKNNQMLIVVKLNELERLLPNRLVTIPSQSYSKETNTNRWRHNSGYIMLARVVVDKTFHYPDIIWEEKDYTLLKKVKKSIVGNNILALQENISHLE